MGMGKTFQTLAFLGGLMRAKTIRNALIVATKSILHNWNKEANNIIKKCVPSASVKVVSSTTPGHSRKNYLQLAMEW